MPSKKPRLKKHALVGQTTAFKINMAAGNKFAALVLTESFQVKPSGFASDYGEDFPRSFFTHFRHFCAYLILKALRFGKIRHYYFT
jgi:hypothetical protein